MRSTSTSALVAGLSCLFVLLLQGCDGCRGRQTTDCPQDIVFQLNWTDDPTFTGEYIAKEKYWVMDKLNVTIKQGGMGIDPISMVVSEKADYAVVGADKALMAISDGKPIRIISVDLQRNPVGWIVRQDLRILSFEDLRNRPDIILGDKTGTEVSSILQLVLKRRNLPIKPQAVSFDFAYFIANEKVVYPVYLNEEPVKATLVHNLKIVEIDPSAEQNGGIRMYGNVIITHDKKVAKCSKQVALLLKGLKAGWEEAKGNRQYAVGVVSRYVKNDIEYVRQTMDRSIKFATEMYGRPVPAGHMELTVWEATLNVLKEANLIVKDVDLTKAVYLR